MTGMEIQERRGARKQITAELLYNSSFMFSTEENIVYVIQLEFLSIRVGLPQAILLFLIYKQFALELH